MQVVDCYISKLLNLVTFIAIIFTSNIQIISISLAKGDGWVVVVDCNIALLKMVNIVTFIIFIISTSLSQDMTICNGSEIVIALPFMQKLTKGSRASERLTSS